MLSKRYKSTEVDRRTWLHVPSGTHWFTSSDTHQIRKLEENALNPNECITRVLNYSYQNIKLLILTLK